MAHPNKGIGALATSTTEEALDATNEGIIAAQAVTTAPDHYPQPFAGQMEVKGLYGFSTTYVPKLMGCRRTRETVTLH